MIDKKESVYKLFQLEQALNYLPDDVEIHNLMASGSIESKPMIHIHCEDEAAFERMAGDSPVMEDSAQASLGAKRLYFIAGNTGVVVLAVFLEEMA